MLKTLFKRFTMPFSNVVSDPLAALTLPELIKLNNTAKQIDLTSRKIVSTTLAGDKLATFRGRGMDFDESRVYQQGDDIRLIYLLVTARSGKTHTKIYHEERERPIYCLVDCSSAMWFGTQNTFKAVVAAHAASIMAWAAVNHGDRVGAVVCSTQKVWSLKPTAGRRGVLRLLHLLAKQQPEMTATNNQATLFEQSLLQLRHVAKPGSVVFIFSDGSNLTKMAEQHIARLRQRGDVLFGFIYDPLEAKLPESGIYSFTDGDNIITYDASDKTLANDYQTLFKQRFEQVKTITNRYQIPLFTLQTAESTTEAIKHIFAARKTRDAYAN